jgi:bifunctional UDP-N-acetylglucosamine pyrophosphorylase/glucosamine-1-phosphate N-acetyltransferase
VLHDAGYPVGSLVIDDPVEVQGVNDRAQLATAEAELRARTNRAWQEAGVTMLDPTHTYVDVTVELAPDVTLFPGTILQGATVVGPGAEIGPSSRLVDTKVGAGSIVANTIARNAVIGADCVVGPFAALDPGTELSPGTRTGAFYTAPRSDEA